MLGPAGPPEDFGVHLLYLAGLSHSGSTLLDLLLSGHPQVVGLGEIHPMVEPELRQRQLEVSHWAHCSCGRILERCSVWGPHFRRLRENPDEGAIYHLRRLLQDLEERSGNVVYTDSSKHRGPLARYLDLRHDLPGQDSLKAIHLLKDARGYALSARRRFPGRFLGGVRHLLHWYRENRALERTLRAAGVPTITVSYEEVCFRTVATVERITAFLNLPPAPEMEELGGARGHVGTGNPMRLDESRSSRILYDHRWLLVPGLQAAYLALPFVRRYNEARVYGRIDAAGTVATPPPPGAPP